MQKYMKWKVMCRKLVKIMKKDYQLGSIHIYNKFYQKIEITNILKYPIKKDINPTLLNSKDNLFKLIERDV